MSKYIYTTIYEEFTGMKPPEPKPNRPKTRCSRRSTGHPYKSRIQNPHENNYPKKKANQNFSFMYSQQHHPCDLDNNHLNNTSELTIAKIKNYHFNNKLNNDNRKYNSYKNTKPSSVISYKQRRYKNNKQEDYDF